tara:strand:- start:70120 stop:70701 length:582 start_codon:yes stop_codon:yes gene_type:complete
MSRTVATIDLESMSLRTDAVIVSVGVVFFDLEEVDTFEDLLKRGTILYVSAEEQAKNGGRRADSDTLDWWRKRPEDVQDQLSHKGVSPAMLADLMTQMMWANNTKRNNTRWYARGPQFDIAKLEDLFWQFEVTSPWHYRKPRCSRTFLEEHGVEDDGKIAFPAGMIPHNALHDAAFEAFMMQRAYNGVPMIVN